MGVIADVIKRFLVGRPLRSESAGEQELPKRIALPIFASDPLSSVAYATQEIMIVLTTAGTLYLHVAKWIALAVVTLLTIVVASYRQLVHAYPSGGGDYEVSMKNIGPVAGVTVASALLVDYVMTVAVSVSAGVDNLISLKPDLHGARVTMALAFVVLLAAINLRGVKESGKAFAIPTYGFVVAIYLMFLVAGWRYLFGTHPVAESARYAIEPEHGRYAGMALVFFALKAFASGCTALTGVEAIANGVPSFKKPKSKNAATTLLLMGSLAMSMFVGITALALSTKVHYADNACSLQGFADCGDVAQRTVIAQLGSAVFGAGSPLFAYLQIVTAGILVLAANTAFNGFPLLGSILAQDKYMPRQLHNRGDRLVYSNGVLLLSAIAGSLIYAFHADVTRLIQLYIVGVFTSFTLGQTGMVRHWNRELSTGPEPARRRQVLRSRAINATGATATGLVLVIVTVEKFTHGAYLVVIAMPVLFMMMKAINKHYSNVSRELEVAPDAGLVLPSRMHAIVLVSKVHGPTLRALSYAQATRPSTLVALTAGVDAHESEALQAAWARHGIDIPLVVIDSPYREITRPILEYVRRVRVESPRDVVCVYIPEYVVGHWWEQLLHNQSALRLKSRLLFQPGVMVTSVPYQLASSSSLQQKDARDSSQVSPGT